MMIEKLKRRSLVKSFNLQYTQLCVTSMFYDYLNPFVSLKQCHFSNFTFFVYAYSFISFLEIETDIHFLLRTTSSQTESW